MVFFTSDLHLNESTFIGNIYTPPEVNSIEKYNKYIIKNWNSVVSEDDTVFIVGDIGRNSNNNLKTIFSYMKGKKILIYGNHDSNIVRNNPSLLGMDACYSEYLYKSSNYRVYMKHKPVSVWNYSTDNPTYHAYGHIHNCDSSISQNKYALNACACVNNFTPQTFNQLKYNNNQYRKECKKQRCKTTELNDIKKQLCNLKKAYKLAIIQRDSAEAELAKLKRELSPYEQFLLLNKTTNEEICSIEDYFSNNKY